MASIKGHVDVVTSTEVRGWAVDTGAPERRLQVEFLSGDRTISSSIADKERPDLASLGLGRTDFAFSITIPQSEILDPGSLSVRVDGNATLKIAARAIASNDVRQIPVPSSRPIPPAANKEPSSWISSEVADALRGSIDLDDDTGTA